MPNLDVLFSSCKLNGLSLANRIVMAPMTRSRSPGGVPTAEVASYYRRRAENGVGLIITEAAGIDRPAALNEPDMPRFHGEAALARWKNVVDEVHGAGGRIVPQLVHVGHKLSNLIPFWKPSAPYESPSGISVVGERISQPMSDADVAHAIDAFARAASDAERLKRLQCPTCRNAEGAGTVACRARRSGRGRFPSLAAKILAAGLPRDRW
ncbi:hypothetical protein VSR34_31720 [Paraburkholderia sp. JHI2823]|uniref:oxidoreductase n=1 Tax=Paraburkholderia sp. JHI2823 TaxID=3112960 RepID=UPI00318084ED